MEYNYAFYSLTGSIDQLRDLGDVETASHNDFADKIGTLVEEGWEVVSHSVTLLGAGVVLVTFVLRRPRESEEGSGAPRSRVVHFAQ